MKKLMFILALLIFAGAVENTEAKRFGVSIGVFYGELSPYGRWIEIAPDIIVWKPNKRFRHFKPYVRGNWIYTNYGWYWNSYEPFGHIVYHYGRWAYDDYYSWVWIPDYEWAPAWVEWCYNDDYIGWAPMGPVVNIYIRLGITHNHDRYRYRSYNFVRYRNFGSSSLDREVVSEFDNRKILDRGGLRNEVTRDRDRFVNMGVDRDIIRDRGGNVFDEKRIEITRDGDTRRDKSESVDNSTLRIRTVDRDKVRDDDKTDYQIEKRSVKDDSRSDDVKIDRDRSRVNVKDETPDIRTRKDSEKDNDRVINRKEDETPRVTRENKSESRTNTNERRTEYKETESRETKIRSSENRDTRSNENRTDRSKDESRTRKR